MLYKKKIFREKIKMKLWNNLKKSIMIPVIGLDFNHKKITKCLSSMMTKKITNLFIFKIVL